MSRTGMTAIRSPACPCTAHAATPAPTAEAIRVRRANSVTRPGGKQLVGEVIEPIPAEPGQPERFDFEYTRNGTANLFMISMPLLGWRAVHVTKAGDGETLPMVLEQAEANLPEGRIETLAFDKAGDSDEVHRLLSRKGIKPLIQMRGLWQGDRERMLPGHDGTSNVVYDELGTIYCYDKISGPPVRHPMSYIGYDPERETLKYRCPAKHEGWECPMSRVCNAGKSYGKTVRVSREVDLRRFPALPRATKKFERLYNGRTAVERVNARLRIFWGVDDGNVTGTRRFVAQVGVAMAMAVHGAFTTLLALAPRREGTLGKLRLNRLPRRCRQGQGRSCSGGLSEEFGTVADRVAIAVRGGTEEIVKRRGNSR
jgi:hypothetical protein